MNIFEEVKERADILKVCDILGIKLNNHYKCLCPFPNHKEKTPSFSVLPSENIFFCFGCGERGDVITLVAKILNVKPLEAAQYINTRLGLGIEQKNMNKVELNSWVNTYEQKRTAKENFKKWDVKAFQILCNYIQLLEKWQKIGDFDDERFVEALQKKDIIDYYITDFFINGTDEDKMWFKKHNGKVVEYCERRVRESRTK